jgi:hypothetical protein
VFKSEWSRKSTALAISDYLRANDLRVIGPWLEAKTKRMQHHDPLGLIAEAAGQTSDITTKSIIAAAARSHDGRRARSLPLPQKLAGIRLIQDKN